MVFSKDCQDGHCQEPRCGDYTQADEKIRILTTKRGYDPGKKIGAGLGPIVVKAVCIYTHCGKNFLVSLFTEFP
jgi:hypothetical protein